MSKQIIFEFKNSTGWITGLTPNLTIVRMTDRYIYDFATATFVSSGGTNTAAMEEIANAHGFYIYDFTTFERGIVYIFKVDGGNTISDLGVRYQATLNDVSAYTESDANVIFTSTFVEGQHSATTKKKYNSKANADAAGTTGLIYTDSIAVDYPTTNPETITQTREDYDPEAET